MSNEYLTITQARQKLMYCASDFPDSFELVTEAQVIRMDGNATISSNECVIDSNCSPKHIMDYATPKDVNRPIILVSAPNEFWSVVEDKFVPIKESPSTNGYKLCQTMIGNKAGNKLQPGLAYFFEIEVPNNGNINSLFFLYAMDNVDNSTVPIFGLVANSQSKKIELIKLLPGREYYIDTKNVIDINLVNDRYGCIVTMDKNQNIWIGAFPMVGQLFENLGMIMTWVEACIQTNSNNSTGLHKILLSDIDILISDNIQPILSMVMVGRAGIAGGQEGYDYTNYYPLFEDITQSGMSINYAYVMQNLKI